MFSLLDVSRAAFRNPMLYPAQLRGHCVLSGLTFGFIPAARPRSLSEIGAVLTCG
jgi:hypothetical protein